MSVWGKSAVPLCIFCRFNEAPKDMPIPRFALEKLQRQCVTLVSMIKETAAPSEKEGLVFC